MSTERMATAHGEVATPEWRQKVPVLRGAGVTLREVEVGDAPSLVATLATDEVARYISAPPRTSEAFARFIRWMRRQRAAGSYVCFAVVPAGGETAVGLFQVRRLDPVFDTAQWGFALASGLWGTGLFAEAARLVLEFVFDTLRVRRLEARAAAENGRGNGALRKIGAVREAVLRHSFVRHGRYHDQILWTILDVDWRRATIAPHPTVH